MLDYQKQLRQIYSNNKQTSQILAAIKAQINPSDFGNAINSYKRLQNSKIANLKFKNILSIQQRDTLDFTKDLKRELFWLLYNFKQEANTINAFLEAKSQFENFFILCKYKEAQHTLDEIRKSFGESLWAFEMSLLLKEYQFETKENWIELSSFLTKLKSPFYQFIINFYSKRIEKNMSFENCFTQFQNDFTSINAEHIVKDFLIFKSLYITSSSYSYKYQNLEHIFYISNLFGVIDQYLITVDALLKIISQNENNDKLLAQFIKKLNNYIPNNCTLFNILNTIDSTQNLKLSSGTSIVLPIIDNYIQGNFITCLQLCTQYLKNYPHYFELYEFYVKSSIWLNIGFQETGISTFVDRILEAIFNILLHNKERETGKDFLLKMSLSLLNFDFGKQLFAFATNASSKKNTINLIGYLSSCYTTPKLFSINLGNREKLIVKKINNLPNNLPFQLNRFISGSITTNVPTINYLQELVYQTMHNYNCKNFEKSIQIAESLKPNELPPFYYYDIASILLDSYLKTNRIKSAIILATNILINDLFYINKSYITNLTTIIKTEDSEEFYSLIDTPILFSVLYKEYDLYAIYSEFMFFYNEEYPSKLDINLLNKSFSPEKVIYFLREVCKIDIFRYSPEFDSINEAEQERCNICDLLKNIDKENSGNYDKEIEEIRKSSAVRKALKEVNKSKLYVNIESLKEIQIKNITESFTRYQAIDLISKDKILTGFNSSKEMDWNSYEPKSKETDLKFNDPSFLSFKFIYLDTRDKFLFNKAYGLDSCLSTNFRHGSIKNHIRSVFEKLNLITNKQNDIYIDNIYWANKIDASVNDKVQNILKDFSKEIDAYIEYISDNIIQIQTERHTEKNDGIFNYFTSDSILWNFFQTEKNRFTSVDIVIDALYINLINYTKLNIYKLVYNFLTKVIFEKFQKIINQLINNLKKINFINLSELQNCISKSSTSIQSELEVIAEWFYLNTTNSSSLLDIETIIHASKEYINGINPNRCISPKVDIFFPIPAYSNFIYIFNILFTNIIIHSKLKPNDINVQVKVYMPRLEQVEIKVINNISEDANKNDIQQKLQNVKDNWNNHNNIERSNIEGGSGFDKIKRLLLYDVIAKTDKFEFLVAQDGVSISLFLPFKPQSRSIEDIVSSSFDFIKDKIYPKAINSSTDIASVCTQIIISTNYIFVFGLIIEKIVGYPSQDNANISIKVESIQNETILYKFTNTSIKNIDIVNTKNSLEETKNNWHLLDTEQQETNSFENIKQILFDEKVLVTSTFEYFIDSKQIIFSLHIPLAKK